MAKTYATQATYKGKRRTVYVLSCAKCGIFGRLYLSQAKRDAVARSHAKH